MSETNHTDHIARAEDGDIRTPEQRGALRREARANSMNTSRKIFRRSVASAMVIGALAPTMGPAIVSHVEHVVDGGNHPAQPSHLQNEVQAQTAQRQAAELAADHINGDQR